MALSFSQAALGTTIKVPTLDEAVEIDVAHGTQPGTLKVLRGRGMPNVHGRGQGDLAVRLTVAVPKKLNAEQRALIENLAKALGDQQPAAETSKRSDEDSGFSFFKRKKKR